MVLITGANGQLGYDFKRLFNEKKIDYIATDIDTLDITDIDSIRKFVQGKNIKLIINCAAYNNVDKAELEMELCKKLNTYAPRDLAIVANEIKADYITYSTDFVFDGTKGSEYTEEDAPNPISFYGRTKYEGEKEVLNVKPNSYIIRTSWVFGVANNNFNTQVINWSKSKDVLSIVDDQISSPTYSKDLAYYSWKLIETGKYGLYHFSNDGIASKYDQARYVLEKIGWQGKLNRAKTKDFNLPAQRPEYSKLNSGKIQEVLGLKIPSWKDGIKKYLHEIKAINKVKFISICIPTRNRLAFLKAGILLQLDELEKLNIPVYIFDNSTDELTKNYIEEYRKKYSNLFYEKNKLGTTYGESVAKGFLTPVSDYIYVIGDSSIVPIEHLKNIIERLKNEKPDFYILNCRVKDVQDKIYSSSTDFFKELTWHCTLIGSTIYSSEIIKLAYNHNIIEKYKQSDFIQLGVLLEALLLKKQIKGMFFKENVLRGVGLVKTSTWRHEPFKVFGEDWIKFIDNLSSEYNKFKDYVIRSHGVKSRLFSLSGICHLRYEGSLNSKSYKEYECTIEKITNINKSVIYLIAKLPKKLFIVFKWRSMVKKILPQKVINILKK